MADDAKHVRTDVDRPELGVITDVDDVANTEPVMPFGRHRGKALGDVPSRYLKWVGRQDWMREPLAGQIAAELYYRGLDL